MRGLLAGLVFVAVAVGTAGAAVARSDQARLLDTLVVQFADATPVQSKVKLARDVAFTIVVSGSGFQTSKEGTVTCDVLYCLGRDTGTPIPRRNLGFKTEFVSDWQSLAQFVGKSDSGIPYSASHTYTVQMRPVQVPEQLEVRSNFAHFLGCSASAGVSCSGTFTVKIYWPGTQPEEEEGCKKSSYREPASRSAINEVRVVACTEEVDWRRRGGEWKALKPNDILTQGDEISTDPDGSVTLAFADNSTVTVRNVTQLHIGSFFTEGGVVRTELILKMGEISAKVNKSEATRSDFKIKGPASAGSVRGTEFSVFVDPVSKASIWSVKSGVVEVDPAKGATVMVGAGKAVEATPAGVGVVTVLGGLNRAKATALVLKTVARFNDACGLTTPRAGAYSAKTAGNAWLVTVKVSGNVKGASTWHAAGSRATPQNAVAKQIAGGCRSGGGGPQGKPVATAAEALAIVERVIKDAATACQITEWRIRAEGRSGAWTMTANVTEAGVSQTAGWNITGDKLVARDAVAQEISRRCQ